MTPVDATAVHARARVAASSLFGLNGFVLGMWIVNIPVIKDRAGIDTATLGLLLLLLGGSAWVGMQLSGRAVDAFGSRAVLTTSAVALSLAVPAPGLSTDAVQLGLALTLLGFANGFVDVAQNSQAVVVEREYGRPIMSSFHAVFSAGGLLAAVLGGALIAAGTDVRVILAVAAALGVAVALSMHRMLLPAPTTEAVDAGAEPAPRSAPWTGRLLLMGLLAFALFLGEGVAYDWSTVHLRDSLGSTDTVAALGYGAFSVAMLVVRLFADRVVARTGPATYVRFAALVGAAGLTLAALAPSPALGIAAWALFGAGLAGCIPQFFSAAGNLDREASGLYLARVAGFGYVGLLAGPSVIGLLTRWMPLTAAFTLPIAACVLAGVLAPRVLAGADAAPARA